jgi:hypothetical protein
MQTLITCTFNNKHKEKKEQSVLYKRFVKNEN